MPIRKKLRKAIKGGFPAPVVKKLLEILPKVMPKPKRRFLPKKRFTSTGALGGAFGRLSIKKPKQRAPSIIRTKRDIQEMLKKEREKRKKRIKRRLL